MLCLPPSRPWPRSIPLHLVDTATASTSPERSFVGAERLAQDRDRLMLCQQFICIKLQAFGGA